MELLSEAMSILLSIKDLLYSLLVVVAFFAAYEFNRRYNLVSVKKNPQTKRLFAQLRFLFLFVGIHFSTDLMGVSLDQSYNTIIDLLRTVSDIGIGGVAISVALSRILAIGKTD